MSMLPNDKSRCAAVRDFTTNAEVCPHREDCERFLAWKQGGADRFPVALWRCETDRFEAKIPKN